MILDIDVGNSSVKWILRGGADNSPAPRGRVAHGELDRWLGQFGDQQLTSIRLCSVVGSATEVILAWAQRTGTPVGVATVQDGAGGVRCGYRDPSRLGVDRWLAMVAARQACSQTMAVVDAGTALTVDIVDAAGQHLGGYIVPGLGLMAKSLGDHTWGVRAPSSGGESVEPGRATAEAVGHGCLLATLGLVESLVERQALRALFITGGDGACLVRHLRLNNAMRAVEIVFAPSLVLDGLAVALPLS